jgi:hypothetical protein
VTWKFSILDIIKVYRVAWPNAPRPSDGGIYATL